MTKKLKEITKANITHISFVPKGANGQDFLIVKAGDDVPNLIHEAPIIKVDEDKHLVTGVVYAPDAVDSQGEFMRAEAIEKAAHDFMQTSGQMDERHNFVTNESVSVVESYVAKSDTEIEGQTIKKGTWLITAKVEDDKLWGSIKKGEYKGFSMGGTGTRKEVEVKNKVEKEEQGLFAVLKDFFSGADKQERAGMQDELEGIGKAGKSFSSANANKIKAAHSALSELLSLMSDSEKESESENEMKKEELQKVVKEAMQPITDRLEKLEKGDGEQESAQGENVTKEALQSIVKEAIEPMMERLEKVEKTRGLSNQAQEEEIAKGNRVFSSVEI